MSGVDGAFLHLETPETPMHVASLHLFDLPAGYRGDFHADVKRQMRKRLHVAPVFTRKLAPMPLQFANPVWVEDDAVDLDHHVQRVTLPAPGTQAQFEDCAGELHSQLLDRSRPLWRLTIIDGLQSGQVGYYIKVHHAVVDGLAGVMLAQALFDIDPTPRRIPRQPAPPAEHPGAAELATAALRHDAGQLVKLLRHLPDVAKTLTGLFGARAEPAPGGSPAPKNFAFGPKTPINVPIGGERGFAAVSVPLDTLKQLAAAHEAKLNDIVLALCSGALRRYLARHGGIPKKPLIATMPISLRAPGNTEYRTQATLSLVNLNTQIADPVKRLRAIRDAAGAVKAMASRAKQVIPTDFPSIGTPWLLHGLATLYGRLGLTRAMPPIANLVISNVPGPTVPLYVAGARMATYWPMSIVEHGVGLNVTVMSYAGAMGFGFTTARNAVPDARELSQALLEALDELVARGLPAARKKAKPAAAPAARRRAGAAPA
ncbi:MAG: wax ester/triacylglycerol synthase family O-acyltransferase [Burkholderiaceae bacterium]|nr:wax ester/triacylglycerol synthase family O-acyltransferase [Burkholderiaceae bacterium]